MLSDIFSGFDQPLTLYAPLALLSILLLSHYSQSTILTSLAGMTSYIIEQTNTTKAKELLPGKTLLSTLFLYLMIFNLSGLWPYLPSITSHLWFAVSLGLIFWGSLLISGALKFPMETIAHLYPSGAPLALGPLLVLIETISILIRPITLSVRLVANMSAGHIVIAMISMYPMKMLLLNMFYFLFEVGVSIIQAYIFFLLISLYSNDSSFGVSHKKIWVSKKGYP